MVAASSMYLLSIVTFSTVLVNRMAHGLEDQFSLIKSRDEMCSGSSNKGFVEVCFEKGYSCDLSGPQEEFGRFFLKMCKDDAFRNEYQGLTKCLDGYSRWSVGFYCPGQVFSGLFGQDQTTCQSKSSFFDCFRNLCPGWANVIGTFKDGMINWCSLGSFTYSYKIPVTTIRPEPIDSSTVKSVHESPARSSGNHLASFLYFVITVTVWSLLLII